MHVRTDACADVYVYNSAICKLPSSRDVAFMMAYSDVTATVCEDLCTELEGERCFGIFYNATHQLCYLTSYTGATGGEGGGSGEGDREGEAEEVDCLDRKGLLYFRRKLCLSKC